MTDESHFVELARIAQGSFEARRRYEWRINFSLWGGLATIGAWANRAQVGVFESPCAAIDVGALLIALYLGSLLLINWGHSKDKAWKHYYLDRAIGKDASEPTKYRLEWTQIAWCVCQTGFTLLLTLLVMKVLLKVPPPTPSAAQAPEHPGWYSHVTMCCPLIGDVIPVVVGAILGAALTLLSQWLTRRDSFRQGAYTERAKAVQDLLEYARRVKDACIGVHAAHPDPVPASQELDKAKLALRNRAFSHDVWISDRGVQAIRDFNEAIDWKQMRALADSKAVEDALDPLFKRLRDALRKDLGFDPR